jgi:hypothetical protein
MYPRLLWLLLQLYNDVYQHWKSTSNPGSGISTIGI